MVALEIAKTWFSSAFFPEVSISSLS